jgi:hypothetical protein
MRSLSTYYRINQPSNIDIVTTLHSFRIFSLIFTDSWVFVLIFVQMTLQSALIQVGYCKNLLLEPDDMFVMGYKSLYEFLHML